MFVIVSVVFGIYTSWRACMPTIRQFKSTFVAPDLLRKEDSKYRRIGSFTDRIGAQTQCNSCNKRTIMNDVLEQYFSLVVASPHYVPDR